MKKKRPFDAVTCFNILMIVGFLWIGSDYAYSADDKNPKSGNARIEMIKTESILNRPINGNKVIAFNSDDFQEILVIKRAFQAPFDFEVRGILTQDKKDLLKKFIEADAWVKIKVTLDGECMNKNPFSKEGDSYAIQTLDIPLGYYNNKEAAMAKVKMLTDKPRYEDWTEKERMEMENKKHKILINTSAEPPADGVLSANGVTIKFIPPKGWKMDVSKDSVGDTHFYFLCPDAVKARLSIYVMSHSALLRGQTIENLLKLQMSNPNNSNGRLIKFANRDAATWLTQKNGLKTKSIVFFINADSTINIDFQAFEQDFNKLIPDVEKSMELFKIISTKEGH